jgi:hypothetical protein
MGMADRGGGRRAGRLASTGFGMIAAGQPTLAGGIKAARSTRDRPGWENAVISIGSLDGREVFFRGEPVGAGPPYSSAVGRGFRMAMFSQTRS